jgi:carbonic anhydrase
MCKSRYLSRREFLRLSGTTAVAAALAGCAKTPISSSVTEALPVPAPKPISEPHVESSGEALERLITGNHRYAHDETIDLHESPHRRSEVSKMQKPMAAIFSCVDSRVPPELVFDRGLGDLFTIRTAGHVLGNAVMGSIEFGVLELGIPLIFVMGHERCGAIKATIEALKHPEKKAPGDIAHLIKSIEPSISAAKNRPGDLLENAVDANVEYTVAKLRKNHLFVKPLAEGKLRIVGGRYDLDTGLVRMLVL